MSYECVRNSILKMIKSKLQILSIVVIAILLVSCKEFGNRKNPLYGKKNEQVEALKHYKDCGGMILDIEKTTYRFALSVHRDSNNVICILNELAPNYQILDTINVTLKDNEFVSWGDCWQDTIPDLTIVALIRYTSIVQAWRADTLTGTFKPIRDLSKIKYIEEDGCCDYDDEDDIIACDTIPDE